MLFKLKHSSCNLKYTPPNVGWQKVKKHRKTHDILLRMSYVTVAFLCQKLFLIFGFSQNAFVVPALAAACSSVPCEQKFFCCWKICFYRFTTFNQSVVNINFYGEIYDAVVQLGTRGKISQSRLCYGNVNFSLSVIASMYHLWNELWKVCLVSYVQPPASSTFVRLAVQCNLFFIPREPSDVNVPSFVNPSAYFSQQLWLFWLYKRA